MLLAQQGSGGTITWSLRIWVTWVCGVLTFPKASMLRRIAPFSLCESLCSSPVVKGACKSAKKDPTTGPVGCWEKP